MAKRRILVFTKLYWPEGSGAELATHLIIKNILSKLGEVIIVSGTRNPSSDVRRYARYIYVPMLKDSPKPLDWFRALSMHGSLTKLIKCADVIYIPSHTLLPIAITARKLNPDARIVLHLHNFQPVTYTSVVYPGTEPSLRTDIVTELGEHSSALRAVVVGFLRSLNILSSLALDYADVIICVSRMQYTYLAKYLNSVGRKGVVIYNPPPPVPKIEKNLDKEPMLIFPGGTSFVKGFQVVFKAIPRILKIAKLYITGGRGIEHKPLILLKRISRKFPDRLHVVGRVPYEEYLKLHKRAWALLYPSIWLEPLPYAVIESILLRTIPIMSSYMGVAELIEGTKLRTFMVKPNDFEELVSRIHDLVLLNHEELLDIVEQSRDKVLKILEKNVFSLARLFQSLI